MSHHNLLISLGYKHVQDIDPAYFEHRESTGYFVLVSDDRRAYYALHTTNAKECTSSILGLLEGRRRDRAVALKKALENTKVQDWCIYFRPGVKQQGSLHAIHSCLSDYSQIKQGSQRLDDNELLQVWFVQHRGFGYARMVAVAEGSSASVVISEYLKKWRDTADSGLRDSSIGIAQYYTASAQHASALIDWMRTQNANGNFIHEALLGGETFTRSDIRSIISQQNNTYSIQYFKGLVDVVRTSKEVIALES